MPINEYFKGGGDKVMSNMTKEYGPKKGKSVFYATANKKGMKPGGKKPSSSVGKNLSKAMSQMASDQS